MTGAHLARIGGRQAEAFGAEILVLRGAVDGHTRGDGRHDVHLSTGETLTHDLLENGDLPDVWALGRPPHALESSVPGIFVAGDVRHGSTKRVAGAVGEGAMAVALVNAYLAAIDRAS